MKDDDRRKNSLSLKSKVLVNKVRMMFVDSGVIADRAYGAVLLMPMRKDMKTAAGEDFSSPMG
jgi:hypothetical protein